MRYPAKNKPRILTVCIIFSIVLGMFFYGVGVGEFHWPPYGLLHSLTKGLSDGFERVSSLQQTDGASYDIQTWRTSYYALDNEGQLLLEELFPYRNEMVYTFNRLVNPQKTAIVVMDPWIDSPSEELNIDYEVIIVNRIIPVVEKGIELGHPIIVLTNSSLNRAYSNQIHPYLNRLVKESCVYLLYHEEYDDREFAAFLRRIGVTSLIYTGFASNLCVIGRPMGIIHMVNNGFRCFSIPEASAAVEFENTWDTGAIHEMTTKIIAQWMAEIININEFLSL
ncbi:MAG: isochorismatase family protein [Bacteroidales bacterium]|nr:isochorismatase family protein [Bacteroidales bacterium]